MRWSPAARNPGRRGRVDDPPNPRKMDPISNPPHDLAEEFPDQRERISALKASNGHFARLAEEYHAVNRHVHRIETRVEPASEDVEEELKRRRVRLKD